MRLTAAQFAILLALSRGEMHGYAILQESAAHQGGLRLGPGTLYRSLKQLSDAGLIHEVGERGDLDQRRRYYRLTDDGKRAAEAEAEALKALVERAQRTGLLRPDAPSRLGFSS